MLNKEKYLINSQESIKTAMTRLNQLSRILVLFVIDDQQKLCGTVTDGDIRRGLLNGKSMDDTISVIMHTKFKFLRKGVYEPEVYKLAKELEIAILPLVDDQHRLVRLVDVKNSRALLPLEAVIMAGGRGERLKPLTDHTPKPLLEIGGKPIIEHNIDRLIEYGVSTMHLSVRYLAEKIEQKFGDGSSKEVKINYIHENDPLGTLGAVSLIDDFKQDQVLIMNSDLLTNIDFEDFYNTFVSEQADMAVASIPYQVKIPYAILEKQGSRITALEEKPTYTYYSNAGIYLVKTEVLKRLARGKFYNATDLIESLIETGKKVISFPILGYWLDIGQHEDYKKAQEDFNHIRF